MNIYIYMDFCFSLWFNTNNAIRYDFQNRAAKEQREKRGEREREEKRREEKREREERTDSTDQ